MIGSKSYYNGTDYFLHACADIFAFVFVCLYVTLTNITFGFSVIDNVILSALMKQTLYAKEQQWTNIKFDDGIPAMNKKHP